MVRLIVLYSLTLIGTIIENLTDLTQEANYSIIGVFVCVNILDVLYRGLGRIHFHNLGIKFAKSIALITMQKLFRLHSTVLNEYFLLRRRLSVLGKSQARSFLL